MSSSFPNPLTEKEEQHYVKLLEQGDPAARKALIEHNLRLVAHIAKKYVGPAASQDDLISIGTIGLIKAVGTYSGKKSTRLATYAAKCIENEILMSIRASRRVRQEISLSLPIGVDKDGNEIERVLMKKDYYPARAARVLKKEEPAPTPGGDSEAQPYAGATTTP